MRCQVPVERVPAEEVEEALKAWTTGKKDFPKPVVRKHPMYVRPVFFLFTAAFS
jgi:hypothetical protein